MIIEKKIKGYKFRPECEKYLEAYGGIIGYPPSTIEGYRKQAFVFRHDSMAYKAVESAGVLDLWFEPVYEEEKTVKFGAWNKTDKGHLYFIEDERNWWGTFGLIADTWRSGDNKYTLELNGFYPAEEHEVKDMLIKEAKRRGFKEGVKFIDVFNGNNSEVGSENWQYFQFDDKFSSCFSGYIYRRGKWADIIPKHDFKNGDIVYVKSAILGCGGADGYIGVVTSEQSNRGLGDDDYGVNVKVHNGDVWRVDGKIELATDEQVREAFVKFLT